MPARKKPAAPAASPPYGNDKDLDARGPACKAAQFLVETLIEGRAAGMQVSWHPNAFQTHAGDDDSRIWSVRVTSRASTRKEQRAALGGPVAATAKPQDGGRGNTTTAARTAAASARTKKKQERGRK